MKKAGIKTVGELKKTLSNYDDNLRIEIQARHRVFYLDSTDEHSESVILTSNSLDDYLDKNDFS